MSVKPDSLLMSSAATGPGAKLYPRADGNRQPAIPRHGIVLLLRGGDQGRRMKSSSQKREHIIIVPGSLLATGPHADPGGAVTAHEVDGDLAQDGQVACGSQVPDTAVILTERDI